jgi:hypothetical protein
MKPSKTINKSLRVHHTVLVFNIDYKCFIRHFFQLRSERKNTDVWAFWIMSKKVVKVVRNQVNTVLFMPIKEDIQNDF